MCGELPAFFGCADKTENEYDLLNLYEATDKGGNPDSMAGIFISYRREDTRADAGRLTKELRSCFGERQVFRDIDTIQAGMDFVQAINSPVGSCNVLLAIIGPNWVSAKDERGRPRLES